MQPPSQPQSQSAMMTAPAADLQVVSSAMKDYIHNENEQALETINTQVAKNPGFWRRLFPNEFEKENARIALDRMRTIYETKKTFFKLYTDVQLEIARRHGEALLVTVGADLATKVSAFATEKMEELAQTLGESRERYLARIAPQIDNLENYKKYPELQARAIRDPAGSYRIELQTRRQRRSEVAVDVEKHIGRITHINIDRAIQAGGHNRGIGYHRAGVGVQRGYIGYRLASRPGRQVRQSPGWNHREV